MSTLRNFQQSFFGYSDQHMIFFVYFPEQNLSQNPFLKSYADHHGHLLVCIIFTPVLWSVPLYYEFFSDSVIACVCT